MFGKIVKGVCLVGIGYLVYKVGFNRGLSKVDPVLKQLEDDFKEGKLDIMEFIEQHAKRVDELNK